jgi:hypothetical protein
VFAVSDVETVSPGYKLDPGIVRVMPAEVVDEYVIRRFSTQFNESELITTPVESTTSMCRATETSCSVENQPLVKLVAQEPMFPPATEGKLHDT